MCDPAPRPARERPSSYDLGAEQRESAALSSGAALSFAAKT
jgi:hypothetical protein